LFYKGVYNSSLRILGNREEAEEVMQETFLKVFDRISAYEADAEKMLRILKRIAVNRSIDIYRKRRVRFAELEEVAGQPEEEAEAELYPDPEIVARTLPRLAERDRLILTLRLIEGMEYEEIAAGMKVAISSARSRFTRARQKLVELIKKECNYESLRR
jgi:RNA polymerase sigma-70 factor (ECF subfamily)